VHEDQLRRRIHALGERASSRLGMEARRSCLTAPNASAVATAISSGSSSV
jgi:hypothetical protein